MFPAFLKHFYSRLLDFRGREPRGRFWVFVAVQFGLSLALFMVASWIAIAVSFGAGGSPMAAMLAPAALMALFIIATCAGAIVRRLHDAGRSGWWAAPPAVLLFAGLTLMSRFVSAPQEGGRFGSMLGMMGANFLYLVTLAVLIALCALSGQSDANRYGAPPDQPGD